VFEVGKKCQAKLGDQTGGALHAASFFARDSIDNAEHVTGEDWSSLEDQASDRAAGLALVTPKIEAFRGRFAMTVTPSGRTSSRT
jgi:hypothetical protein